MSKFFAKAAALGVLALGATMMAPAPAQAQCTARFSCEPGVSPVCWFRLFHHSGRSSVFTVAAGSSRTIYGLRPGEAFCSSNRGTPSTGCATRRIRMAC